MIIGLNLGLGSGRRTATVPTLLGVNTSTSGNAAVPTHSAGNLLVAGSTNNNTHSSIAPSLPSPWALGDASHSILGGTNRAAAFFQQIAADNAQTAVWSDTNIPRVVWAFGNAAFDKGIAFEVSTGTSFTWPSLTALSMSSNCIVCACVMTRAAQTDIATAIGTPMAALGFTQRLARNTAPAAWIGDTNSTMLSAFAPSAQTFDSATSGYAGFVFSVKVG